MDKPTRPFQGKMEQGDELTFHLGRVQASLAHLDFVRRSADGETRDGNRSKEKRTDDADRSLSNLSLEIRATREILQEIRQNKESQ